MRRGLSRPCVCPRRLDRAHAACLPPTRTPQRFEGKALLARHRMVNKALEAELKTIHAFSQKALTPEQHAAAEAAQ